jgi:ligand-binding sensor domain-containing protein
MPARAQSPLAFAILLACCASTFALDPSLDVSQYAHTSWKVRDGFTKGFINSIAQTPDGYLWLGTEFGLARFDGLRAIPWQPPGKKHIPAGTVYALVVSRDGALWIGTTKGLASWKEGNLTRFPELDGDAIFSILEDREGTIWVGVGGPPHSGKLCAIRNGPVDCFGGDGRLGPGIAALYEDKNGNLWAGAKEGLWRWKPGPPKFYSLPGELDGIQAIAEDSDGALLVGWKGGIYRLINGKMEPYPVPDISRQFPAKRILADRNSGLWIATWNHGLLHVHQGRTDMFSATDGLSGDDVNALFEDAEGNIWISTIEGIDRFREFAVPSLTSKQGLSKPLVGAVLAARDGEVWLSTYGGLNRWVQGEVAVPNILGQNKDGKLNGSLPTSLFQD